MHLSCEIPLCTWDCISLNAFLSIPSSSDPSLLSSHLSQTMSIPLFMILDSLSVWALIILALFIPKRPYSLCFSLWTLPFFYLEKISSSSLFLLQFSSSPHSTPLSFWCQLKYCFTEKPPFTLFFVHNYLIIVYFSFTLPDNGECLLFQGVYWIYIFLLHKQSEL